MDNRLTDRRGTPRKKGTALRRMVAFWIVFNIAFFTIVKSLFHEKGGGSPPFAFVSVGVSHSSPSSQSKCVLRRHRGDCVVFVHLFSRRLVRQGRFFILFGDYTKEVPTVALGPDRSCCHSHVIASLTFLLLFTSCVVYSIASMRCPEIQTYPLWWQILFVAILVTMDLSYLYTGICDPGVIRRSTANSLANKVRLESQHYVYCSLCDLYRPANAAHCQQCGVCILDRDHHCVAMGYCLSPSSTVGSVSLATTSSPSTCSLYPLPSHKSPMCAWGRSSPSTSLFWSPFTRSWVMLSIFYRLFLVIDSDNAALSIGCNSYDTLPTNTRLKMHTERLDDMTTPGGCS